jgi:hypothetical protein
MNNLKDIISLLSPITEYITIVIGLLYAIIKLIDQIKELWARLKPTIKYLVLLATQVIPVGMVIWYYMYWAVQYHDRFTDRGVFLLLVAEPTMLIIVYEMFWGTWLHPKLLSFVKPKIDAGDKNKQGSKTKPPSKKKSSGG